MARLIHKVELPLDAVSEDCIVKVELPSGAKPLSVAFQGDKLILWYIFIRERPVQYREQRLFHVVMTGQDVPTEVESSDFIGTAVYHGERGPFVAHVFLFI